jgi:hypothetical protein
MVASERVRGFLASCWHFRNKIVWSWDFLAALVVGVLALFLPSNAQLVDLSMAMGSAGILVGTTLIGVVIAGLAVVVALLDDQLLALMQSDEVSGGVSGHLFPFWFVTATGVATVLLAVLLTLESAVTIAPDLLRAPFVLVASLLVWTVLGVLNLVGSLQATGVTRAMLGSKDSTK